MLKKLEKADKLDQFIPDGDKEEDKKAKVKSQEFQIDVLTG